MEKNGFSMLEICISLILMSLTILAVLKQHLANNQLYNDISSQGNALTVLDNISESWYVNNVINPIYQPKYSIKTNKLDKGIQLEFQCTKHQSTNQSKSNCHFTRILSTTKC